MAIESNNLIGFGYQNHNKYNDNSSHKKPPASKDKKKMFKGGPMNFIKVALYMLRKKNNKTSKKMSSSFPITTNSTLNQLVGACRPLHYQGCIGGMSPPPAPLDLPESKVVEAMVSPNERYKTSPPYNSNYAVSTTSSSSSSYWGMSRYASAQSLYDLDDHDDDEDEDEDAYYDGIEGDEMIDTKADMFIASFYLQMRLQDV